MAQYIGKTISLISVTDNRYVGLLEDIDSDKGTVTLQNVRCFGTEGRKNWGPEEIYPNPNVYRDVRFNGNEVKDLSILDVKLEEVQPVLPPQSVLQRSVPAAQQPAAAKQQNQPQVPAAVAGYGVYAPEASATQPAQRPVTKSSPMSQQNDTERREVPQGKGHSEEQRPRTSNGRKVEIPKEDFDFQGSNAKFTKDGLEGAYTQQAEIAKPEVPSSEESNPDHFYNKKSSFFDNISTSTETNTNLRWQEEKAMNLDTFGQASARPRFSRGGHRGGRGGRGRGRGRGGRGGFQNRNNFNQNDNQRGQQPPSQQVEF